MEPRRISRHSAIAGTAIWIVWQLVTGAFAPAVLFALSPLVLVPLLMSTIHVEGPGTALTRGLAWSQLLCALPLPLAMSLPAGPLAMISCLPWFCWTAALALEGLARLRQRWRAGGWRALYDGELAIIAGLGFPVIGSGWLLCDRLALAPLGFSPLIVLLTAVHFHHAGFTLPLSAGLLARWQHQRPRDSSATVWRLAALGVVVSVPLVAIGISVSPEIELFGAWLTAAAAITVGCGLLVRARSLPVIPALLSALAGASLIGAMVFSASYAWTEFHGVPWPDIMAMVQLHGAVNALGFGLLGAWAWHLTPPPALVAASS